MQDSAHVHTGGIERAVLYLSACEPCCTRWASDLALRLDIQSKLPLTVQLSDRHRTHAANNVAHVNCGGCGITLMYASLVDPAFFWPRCVAGRSDLICRFRTQVCLRGAFNKMCSVQFRHTGAALERNLRVKPHECQRLQDSLEFCTVTCFSDLPHSKRSNRCCLLRMRAGWE